MPGKLRSLVRASMHPCTRERLRHEIQMGAERVVVEKQQTSCLGTVGIWAIASFGELWFFAPSPWSSYFWMAKRMRLPWSWEWLDASDLETMAWPEHVGEPRRLAWVCGFLEGSEALFRGLCGPAGTLHNAGSDGCQVQPTDNPTIRELVYCFNDPMVDPPGNRPANERRQSWRTPTGSLSGQLPWRHYECVV